jgi:DNA-binding NtrC family response regulator
MKKVNVLVVDREKEIRLSLTTNLESAGYLVCMAENGEEDIRIIGSPVKFDIVFLDMKLSGIDGIEVLKRLKELAPELNIVLMIDGDTTGILVQAMKFGVVDFIQKPFTAEQVREIAATVVKRQSFDKSLIAKHMVEFAKEQIVKKEFVMAKEWLQKATLINPCYPEAFKLLGAILEIEDQKAEAQKMYQIASTLETSCCKDMTDLHHSA